MPQFFNPDIKEYLTLNGFKDITEQPHMLVFIRRDEAVIFWGLAIIYKKNTCQWATNMMAVANSWQTLKKYFGFNGEDMFTVMMMLHLMGVVKIQEVTSALQNDVRGVMLDQLIEMIPM